ncbi:histone-like nucleoid-structuring protein Lsr2 [Nocardia sp. NPDC055029]
MAKKVVVTLVDDFDGASAADGTVAFELDGVAYEIDLSDANATKLRDEFAHWTPFARRTGRVKSNSRHRPDANVAAATRTRRNDVTSIRAWANENGYPVSARGRISADVIAAYEKASA